MRCTIVFCVLSFVSPRSHLRCGSRRFNCFLLVFISRCIFVPMMLCSYIAYTYLTSYQYVDVMQFACFTRSRQVQDARLIFSGRHTQAFWKLRLWLLSCFPPWTFWFFHSWWLSSSHIDISKAQINLLYTVSNTCVPRANEGVWKQGFRLRCYLRWVPAVMRAWKRNF